MIKKYKVFKLVLQIPRGKVTTYREIALKLNLNPRQIGKILSENEDLDKIKCYKVVRSDGKVGGYKLGVEEKIRRLEGEGIKVRGDRIVNFREKLYAY